MNDFSVEEVVSKVAFAFGGDFNPNVTGGILNVTHDQGSRLAVVEFEKRVRFNLIGIDRDFNDDILIQLAFFGHVDRCGGKAVPNAHVAKAKRALLFSMKPCHV